jgi:UDP-N-acetylmuramoyl-tripeptide--D-alanyl-D-alanine ligase
MIAALDLLALMDGQRIAVIGDMLELGEKEHDLHREVLEHALGTAVDWVVAIGPRMAEAAKTVHAQRLHTFDAPAAAIPWLRTQARAGGTWLLKGSRGVKVEAILEGFETEGER